MRVTWNGEARELRDGLTVLELLEVEREPAGHVVVEVNREYLARRAYARVLREGDLIEIIRPAFGG